MTQDYKTMTNSNSNLIWLNDLSLFLCAGFSKIIVVKTP